MAVLKCKMCGGDLVINEQDSIAECEHCGTKQTVPKAVSEDLQNLFNRANTLRIKSEFDKAEKIYERIIQADDKQPEAYWGLILCKYGIEYVDDPATLKKIPTCHRASFDSIVADDDYKSAIENADLNQRIIYEEQAREIDRIQKEILALAQKEETYDVFICYKETDSSGKRTQDSVIANDIYYQLTQEGFKVFYAAITLEGKLGSAYEPIIFAALNSAKVMLAIGTKPEYFNAVWVKNEWSRYLKIVKKDRSKLLVPCYRDMDAYELPEEFAHLQAQDMAKIGFINDLVRGIKKVVKKDEPKPQTVVKETVIATGNANVVPLLKRVSIFLSDGDWKSADEYCEKVLDVEPENAQAYAGKLCAEFRLRKLSEIKNGIGLSPEDSALAALAKKSKLNAIKVYCDRTGASLADAKSYVEGLSSRKSQINSVLSSKNYKKISQFGDAQLKQEIESYINAFQAEEKRLIDESEERVKSAHYNSALEAKKNAKTDSDFIAAAQLFAELGSYRDSEAQKAECELRSKELVYAFAMSLMESAKNPDSSMKAKDIIAKYERAAKAFSAIPSYRDSNAMLALCNNEINTIKMSARNADIYNRAMALHSRAGISNQNEAIKLFTQIAGWKDANDKIAACRAKIDEINEQIKAKEAEQAVKRKKKRIIAIIVVGVITLLIAIALFVALVILPNSQYKQAVKLIEEGKYDEAEQLFDALDFYGRFSDQIDEMEDQIVEGKFNKALALMQEGKYEEAKDILSSLKKHSASAGKLAIIEAIDYINAGNYDAAIKTTLRAGETFKLCYNLDGGKSATGSDLTLTSASQYKGLTTPTREGFKFIEWKLENCGFTEEGALTITLKAIWSDKYTITYDLDGGNATNPGEYRTTGGAITLVNPTRTGHDFLGWTGTDLSSMTKNVTIPAGSYGDRSYTANWKPSVYTISLDPSGGKLVQTTVTVTYGSAYNLPQPYKTYYTFDSWYSGTEKIKTSGVWNYTSGTTLNASYTPIEYTITYNLDGGRNSSANPSSYNIESDSIIFQDPTKYGYDFVGWYSDRALSKRVTQITPGSNGEVTLYAKWTLTPPPEPGIYLTAYASSDMSSLIGNDSDDSLKTGDNGELKLITKENDLLSVTYGVDSNLSVSIKDYPVMIVLTKNFCTCSSTCRTNEVVYANILTSNAQTPGTNNRTSKLSVCYDPIVINSGAKKGTYLYFTCNTSSSMRLSGYISGVQLDLQGLDQYDGSKNSATIVFIGFFKTVEDAEKYVNYYLEQSP